MESRYNGSIYQPLCAGCGFPVDQEDDYDGCRPCEAGPFHLDCLKQHREWEHEDKP